MHRPTLYTDTVYSHTPTCDLIFDISSTSHCTRFGSLGPGSVDATMGSRAKRRRLNELAEEVSIDDICKFADEEEEKKQWNGFCEIESEPV